MPPDVAETRISLRPNGSGQLPSVSRRGELEDWKRLVARHGVYSSRLMLAIGIARAGPLLRLIDSEGGGVHLYGPSTIGKTTALRVAVSVWADEEWMGSRFKTIGSFGAVAAAHNDLFLTLDEIGQSAAQDICDAAYLLANGKGRLYRNSGQMPIGGWRILFPSSGEPTLARRLAEDPRPARGGVQGGQKVRLVDVPADAGAGHGLFERLPVGMSARDLASDMLAGTVKAYGTAGIAFLDGLVASLDEASAKARKLRDDFVKLCRLETGGGAQVDRVAARFGLIAAADELAIEWDILPWNVQDVREGIFQCFRAWFEARPAGGGSSEDAAAIALVQRFLEANSLSRFQLISGGQLASDSSAGVAPFIHSQIILDQVGFRRITKEGTQHLIFRYQWSEEVCRGFDPTATAKLLASKRHLSPGEGKTMAKKESIPGYPDRDRFYVLNPSLLNWSGF